MRKMIRKKTKAPPKPKREKKVPVVKEPKAPKPRVHDRIPEDAKSILLQNKVKIQRHNSLKGKKPKYGGARYVKLHEDCDLLENLIIVRPYIQKKYNINLQLLELLLYLYPKNYFTVEDYRVIPKQMKYYRIPMMIEWGHFVCISKAKTVKASLFTLSLTSRNIVKRYYEHLSGERPLPVSETINPMAVENGQLAVDKLRMDLINSMQNIPVPESKKKLYD